jgi:hypothetical protein
MPLIRRNYLDLTPKQRHEGAKAARDRIKAALATPGLNAKQAADLKAQLDKIQRWESGEKPGETTSAASSSADREVLNNALKRKSE